MPFRVAGLEEVRNAPFQVVVHKISLPRK